MYTGILLNNKQTYTCTTHSEKKIICFSESYFDIRHTSSLISTYEKRKSDLQKDIQISKQINVQNYNKRLTDIQTDRQDNP